MNNSPFPHDVSLVSLAVSTVIFALKADSAGEAASPRLSLRLPLVRRIREPFSGTACLPTNDRR